MTKDEDFKLLKIQTIILRVNIHCDGCKHKVKKLLQRIEGVYTVNLDAENQKVTVSGNVDSATLIKKLAKSGKHAELWSQKSTAQSHKNQPTHSNGKNNNNNNKEQQSKQNFMQGLKALKSQHNKLAVFSSDEDDCEDDEDEDDDDDDFRLLEGKINGFNILKQGNNAALSNAKKNANNAGGGNAKKLGGGGGGGGNPNHQKQVGKSTNSSMPANMSNHNKMGNLGGMNAGMNAHHPHQGDGKRVVNDINSLMGLGLHGLGGQGNGLGMHHQHAQPQPGNTNFPGAMGFHHLSNNGGAGAGAGAGLHHHHHHQQQQQQQQLQSPMMMNLQGYQNHPSLMNLRGLNSNNMMMQQQQQQQQPQPQMVYHRASQMPPYTGYYSPHYYPGPYLNNNNHYSDNGGDYGTHLFSDENTNGCVVM
ncbi:putative heavy metal-associated domain, HMA, heavy metal-associated domain superfamily [Dioscorea sansibarensis]